MTPLVVLAGCVAWFALIALIAFAPPRRRPTISVDRAPDPLCFRPGSPEHHARILTGKERFNG